MRRVSTVSRYLLGIFFTVFGANGIVPFLPQPPVPSGLAGQFHVALAASHYFAVVYFLQLLVGVLLLVGRYVPFALALLAAILTNILVFHMTIAPAGIAPGLVASILWILTFIGYRSAFAPLLRAKTAPTDK
jgi:putative oxidoreductase